MSVGYHERFEQRALHPERSETLRKLARFGYLMKGVVYALIGVLAVLAAMGESEGQVGGQQEAVRTIAAQPFGHVLSVIVGVGLIAYGVWRVLEGALDLRHQGRDGKALVKRLGTVGVGLMNGAIGVFAIDIAVGSGGGAGGGSSTYVSKLMETPFGSVLVGLVGLGFIVYGIAQIGVGWTGKFERRLDTQRMNASERKWVVLAGRAGYIARGIVLPIVGIFLLRAVFQRDPGEAQGLGGALMEIASQPFGQILLIVVALGLVCYGAYSMVFAKYGRLTAP